MPFSDGVAYKSTRGKLSSARGYWEISQLMYDASILYWLGISVAPCKYDITMSAINIKRYNIEVSGRNFKLPLLSKEHITALYLEDTLRTLQ